MNKKRVFGSFFTTFCTGISKVNRKKGFTLIELLVVIAIIALLLSIIMPALRKVKEMARMTVCKTNLKQYGIAMDTYLSNNNQTYPYSFTSLYLRAIPPTSLSCQWHDKKTLPSYTPDNAGPLWYYVSEEGAHMCASFEQIARRYGSYHANHVASVPVEPQYSYSQNAFLGLDTYGIMKPSQIKRNTSALAVFVEESMWQIQENTSRDICSHVLNDSNFMARHPRDPYLSAAGDSVGTYHQNPNVEKKVQISTDTIVQVSEGGVGNVVYADGHVDYVNPYEHSMVNGMRFNKSFLLIYPGRNAMDAKCPY